MKHKVLWAAIMAVAVTCVAALAGPKPAVAAADDESKITEELVMEEVPNTKGYAGVICGSQILSADGFVFYNETPGTYHVLFGDGETADLSPKNCPGLQMVMENDDMSIASIGCSTSLKTLLFMIDDVNCDEYKMMCIKSDGSYYGMMTGAMECCGIFSYEGMIFDGSYMYMDENERCYLRLKDGKLVASFDLDDLDTFDVIGDYYFYNGKIYDVNGKEAKKDITSQFSVIKNVYGMNEYIYIVGTDKNGKDLQLEYTYKFNPYKGITEGTSSLFKYTLKTKYDKNMTYYYDDFGNTPALNGWLGTVGNSENYERYAIDTRTGEKLVKNIGTTSFFTYGSNDSVYVVEFTDDDWAAYNAVYRFYISKNGTCGKNLKWSYDATTGRLNITGSGAMPNYASSAETPWHSYLSGIKSVTIGANVTSIGNNAFNGCTNLSKVWGMANVTSIGTNAFRNARSLTTVAGCTKVTKVGDYAFCNDTLLKTVGAVTGTIKLPSIVAIGQNAFSNCTKATALLTGGNLTQINTYAFKGCTSLTTAYIGSKCTTIGPSAFMDDAALTKVSGMAGVTSIGASAFRNCIALATIEGCKGLTTIGQSAFYNNTSLTTLGDTAGYIKLNAATAIGKYTFYQCSSMTKMTTGTALTFIGDTSMRGCTSLTSVTGLSNVTTISDYAFRDDISLTSLSGCAKVSTVGNYAFYNCTKLNKIGGTSNRISLPAVKSVGKYAFGKCKAAEYFASGASLTSIGEYAFTEAAALKTIYLKTTALGSVGTKAFNTINSKAVIHVPQSKLSTYQNGVLKGKGQASTVVIKAY